MTSSPVLSIPPETAPLLKRRMEGKVTISASGCHEWTAFTTADGYGMVSVKIDGKARMLSAHRASWMVNRGPIPAGHVLDHLCRVRKCVNVEHLEPITPNQNTARGVASRSSHPRPLSRPACVDDKLWKSVKHVASERGDNLSDIIRAALFDYVNAHIEESGKS